MRVRKDYMRGGGVMIGCLREGQWLDGEGLVTSRDECLCLVVI